MKSPWDNNDNVHLYKVTFILTAQYDDIAYLIYRAQIILKINRVVGIPFKFEK